MGSRKSDRKLVSVTMLPALHQKLSRHCKDCDVPISLWVRKLIEAELDRVETT
jgi:hypothetical protein